MFPQSLGRKKAIYTTLIKWQNDTGGAQTIWQEPGMERSGYEWRGTSGSSKQWDSLHRDLGRAHKLHKMKEKQPYIHISVPIFWLSSYTVTMSEVTTGENRGKGTRDLSVLSKLCKNP